MAETGSPVSAGLQHPPPLLDSLVTLSGPLLGVAGFAFGFYQLRRADRARRESEKAQRELAELQADRTEAANRRADRLELYRAHLAKLDGVMKLATDGAQTGELAQSQARMFQAIRDGGDFMEAMGEAMESALRFMQTWATEAERIANETQELRLVASPALLPLLDEYAEAIRAFMEAGTDYLANEAQGAALAIAQGGSPGTPGSDALTAVHDRLKAIRAQIETQMRADLGSDL